MAAPKVAPRAFPTPQELDNARSNGVVLCDTLNVTQIQQRIMDRFTSFCADYTLGNIDLWKFDPELDTDSRATEPCGFSIVYRGGSSAAEEEDEVYNELNPVFAASGWEFTMDDQSDEEDMNGTRILYISWCRTSETPQT